MVARLVVVPVVAAAPQAAAANETVTVCVKNLGKGQTWVLFGTGEQLTDWLASNNQCETLVPAGPGNAYAALETASAKRAVISRASGSTTTTDTDRVDFTIGAGESLTVTFFVDKK